MSDRQLHLVEWLRRIQTEWELDVAGLSKIAHVGGEILEPWLKAVSTELESAPSIPAGLEPAVPLVGLYRQLITVYSSKEEQNLWLKRPNSIFDGHRPIEVIAMSPEHLAYVAYSVESGLRLNPQN